MKCPNVEEELGLPVSMYDRGGRGGWLKPIITWRKGVEEPRNFHHVICGWHRKVSYPESRNCLKWKYNDSLYTVDEILK